MIADEQVTTEPSSLFSAQDQAAIRAQLKKRLILVLIPVLVLLGSRHLFRHPAQRGCDRCADDCQSVRADFLL